MSSASLSLSHHNRPCCIDLEPRLYLDGDRQGDCITGFSAIVDELRAKVLFSLCTHMHTHRYRQTQTHRHRHTDTQTQTHTDTHRHRHRHTDTHTHTASAYQSAKDPRHCTHRSISASNSRMSQSRARSLFVAAKYYKPHKGAGVGVRGATAARRKEGGRNRGGAQEESHALVHTAA